MNPLFVFSGLPRACGCLRAKSALWLVPVVPMVAVVGGLTFAMTADPPADPPAASTAAATPAVAIPPAVAEFRAPDELRAPDMASAVKDEARLPRTDNVVALADPLPDVADMAPAETARPAEDSKRSKRWRIVQRPGLVISKSGASARVAHRHAAKFQCLVDWLDEQGFRIAAMGGIASRPFGGSLHPIGAALDIDQTSRNRLLRGKRYPAGTNEAAIGCGLIHGDRTVWPNYPDYGHFQVAGVTRGRIRGLRNAQTVNAQGESQATISRSPLRTLVGSRTAAAGASPNGALDVR
jgi:hypothetical protein